MSAERIYIHTSDKTKFKSCRLEWDFSSILRQSWRPPVPEAPLGFGTAIHAGLQVWRDPKTASFPSEVLQQMAIETFKRAWKEMRHDKNGDPIPGYDDYLPHRDLGEGMMRHYFGWSERVAGKPIAVEIPFEVPILDPSGNVLCHPDGREVWYKGKIDLLEEDEFGYNIVDYKTVGRWDAEENLYPFLQMGDQVAGYAWALRTALGLQVNRVIYEQLYKGVPDQPARLASPRKGCLLSVNKNQDTTYELMLQAIIEVGESPEQYADYLQYLREGGKQYFRRIPVTKSKAELDYVGRSLYLEAKNMIDPNVDIYPTATQFGCKYCAYKAPCEEVMRCEDPSSTLQQLYIKTKEHYVDYGSHSAD